MRAIILLADGFEESEVIVPWDLMKRANIDTLLVSVSYSHIAVGAHGLNFFTDIPITNIDDEFDLVMLPGGKKGTEKLAESSDVKRILKTAVENDKLITAICAAPSVLGKYGILDGKFAVCYPGYENQLKGATISSKTVVRDGNIITAKGPAYSLEFGLTLVEALRGKETVEKVSAGFYGE